MNKNFPRARDVMATTAILLFAAYACWSWTSKRAATSGFRQAQAAGYPLNSEFVFPFLGTVKAHAREEVVAFRSASGNLVRMPLKVFYGPNGTFMRAEFVTKGAEDFQSPIDVIESVERRASQIVNGLAPQPLAIPLPSILEKVGLPFENATRFDVTHVVWTTHETPSESVLIVNVFGIRTVVNNAFPDTEAYRRCRIVLNENGEVKWMDNHL